MREIPIPPKPATTRYGCDFCKKTTARKSTMERHEKICYYNPDRVCPNQFCDDDGNQCYPADEYEECPYCKTWKDVQEEMQQNLDKEKSYE